MIKKQIPEPEDDWIQQISDRRMILFMLLYFGLLFTMGTVGYNVGTDQLRRARESERAAEYQSLPAMALTLPNAESPWGGVKLELTLGVEQRDTERLQGYMPRIIDRLHTYMSQLDVQQLKTAYDIKLLRNELLTQVNQVSGPVHIKSVYIRKLLTP